MLCDICQRAAIGFCAQCASYYCSDHGGETCFRCSGAFVSTEPAPPGPETRIYTQELESRRELGPGYLPCFSEPTMPTVYVDDPEPPECHICQARAKHICKNCQALYCSEHGRGTDLCTSCAGSSLLGVMIFAGAVTLLLVLACLSSFF